MIIMALIGIIFFLLVIIIGLLFALLTVKQKIEITSPSNVATASVKKEKEKFVGLIKRPTIEELERRNMSKRQQEEEEAWEDLKI